MKSNPAFSFGGGGNLPTALSRLSTSSVPAASTSTQNTADHAVSTFVKGATDKNTLVAMTAGGLAYRFGRIGALLAGSQLSPGLLSTLVTPTLQPRQRHLQVPTPFCSHCK